MHRFKQFVLDTFKHKGLRKQLVEEVRSKGINDERVLAALNAVPRHLFLDNAFLEYAYADQAFPIGEGQTISQPFTVAFQTELLDLKKGEKVLEIGTGSGYQTAVLCEMGAKVFTIERQKALYTKTKAMLAQMGYKAKTFFGDGYKGIPAFAPYDKALVTCGAPYVPDELVNQLKPGGRLVIPVGEGGVQKMMVINKGLNSEISQKNYGEFRFVPMLKDRAGKGL